MLNQSKESSTVVLCEDLEKLKKTSTRDNIYNMLFSYLSEILDQFRY